MEHDLAGLISCSSFKFSEPQIKCYMRQLLCGLDYYHRRGILRRDIKAANILVYDKGNLKIADFGLACFYIQSESHRMTNHVVTLWYRSPEIILGATNYGIGVDLWSAGCVLAELYAGKPIMSGNTELEQLQLTPAAPSDQYVQELSAKIKQDLEADLEIKVNVKVKENMSWMLKNLGEANPGLKFDITDLCATASSDQDDNGTPFTQGGTDS